MVVFYPNIDLALKTKYSYPIMQGRYSREEYLRLTKLTELWYKLHIFITIVFLVLFTIILSVVFYWLYKSLLSILPFNGTLYYQTVFAFAIPSLFIAFPGGCLIAYGVIRLVCRKDFPAIMDLMNVKNKFDSIAGFKWLLKACSVIAIVPLLMVSWCYMTITTNGITVKNVFSLSTEHYYYSDIGRIIHFKHSVDPQKGTYPCDHYRIFLNDGRDLFTVAIYTDNTPDYQEQIINTSRIEVINADVDNFR